MSDGADPSRRGRKGRRHYLARRRTAAHAEAQAQAHAIDHPATPEHPLVADVEPTLASSDAAVAEAVEALGVAEAVAYDTEFIGETSYYPQLCLVQLATPERLVIIDPLGGCAPSQQGQPADPEVDLEPVWRLLSDPSVTKVVHAGYPDVEPATRLHEAPPANLFDTQIAAGFVGLGYPVSLRQLISELLGHELPKTLTFTRWDERPLSEVHLRYAADDVRYLPALHAALTERLAEFGRTAWAAEEFAEMADPANHRFDADVVTERLRQRHRLAAHHTVLLRRLVTWRDRLARRRNLPPRSVLQDKILVAIARAAPTSVDELGEISGVPRSVVQWQGRTLVHTVKRAMQTRAWTEGPKRIRPLSARQRERVDELWEQVKQRCEQMRIAPALLTNRREVSHLVTTAIRRHEPPRDHRLLRGWRRQVVQPILDELGIEPER